MAGSSRVGLIDRLSELRAIVALLFGVYGIVCVIWGLAFTTADEMKKAAGINVNLVAGVGMILFAAVFALWAALRPIEQQQRDAKESSSSEEG